MPATKKTVACLASILVYDFDFCFKPLILGFRKPILILASVCKFNYIHYSTSSKKLQTFLSSQVNHKK